MAQPIPLEVPPRNLRKELHEKLERAPDDHAEAVLAAFELLQEMHDQGILEMARGALSVRDEILGTLAKDASSPEAIRAIRNLLFWRRVLGSIEPDCFQSIFSAIPEGIGLATRQRDKPVTLFGLLRRVASRDSLRAMAAGMDFLQAFGRHLLATEKTAPCNPPATPETKA
jgi:uncharacterized protein YjgD (DUF1641 family)